MTFENINYPATTQRRLLDTSYSITDNSIISFDESEVNLSSLTFQNISSIYSYGTCLKLSNSDLTLSGSIFENIKGGNGGAIYFTNCNSSSISNTKFENISSSSNGGAIMAITTPLTLKNISFLNNKAEDNGGALYLESNTTVTATLTDINFQSNEAAIGGALNYIGVSLQTENITFINNTATKYGSKFASFPTKLKLFIYEKIEEEQEDDDEDNNTSTTSEDDSDTSEDDNDTSNSSDETNTLRRNLDISSSINLDEFQVYESGELKIEDFASGQTYDKVFKFQLLDEMDDPINEYTPLPVMKISIENLEEEYQSMNHLVKSSSILSNEVGFSDGYFTLDDISFTGTKNSTAKVIFESESIINADDQSESYEFLIYVTFRQCQNGEIFNEESNQCVACSSGTYSLNTETDTYCKKCSTQNSESCEGNIIVLKPGYWRESNLTDEIYECSNADNCLGGSENFLCKTGHMGFPLILKEILKL